MAMQFSGLSAEVTISGAVSTSPTLPSPTTTQEIVNVAGTGTGSVQTAYTVPAGKRFLLYGFSIDASSHIDIFKTDGSTKVVNIRRNSTYEGGYFGTSPVPIWIYAAAELVKIDAVVNKTWQIWGVLEDV